MAQRRLPVLLALIAVFAGCGERGGVEGSGFLGDYSQLQPGRADQAQLIYIDPEADFSPYEKILLEPVVVWGSSAEGDASAEELQGLAADFDAALRSELPLEFDLVERAAPGTLRIRAALTRLRSSGASVEMEVLDAESGRRLVAVADSRGADAPSAGDGGGTRAREAFAFWAHRARVRLAAFRSFDASEAQHERGAE